MNEQSAETAQDQPSFAEQVCGHVHPAVLADQVFGSCDQCKRYVLAVLESGWLADQRRRAKVEALQDAAAGLSDDTWKGRGPNLHLDHYPAAESIRAWLNGRADRTSPPGKEPS